jgi:peptide-methionine (R)-S-oxide reductase
MTSPSRKIGRRAFLAATGASALAMGATSKPAAAARERQAEDGFRYEIERSDAEWRAMLDADEYRVLREGGNELPRTSDLWQPAGEGAYHCRGCDLKVFDSAHFEPLGMGWPFFRHGEPRALLMDIDPPVAELGMTEAFPAQIETHCRRCGSHMGYLLQAQGRMLHCVNGTALRFRAAAGA